MKRIGIFLIMLFLISCKKENNESVNNNNDNNVKELNYDSQYLSAIINSNSLTINDSLNKIGFSHLNFDAHDFAQEDSILQYYTMNFNNKIYSININLIFKDLKTKFHIDFNSKTYVYNYLNDLRNVLNSNDWKLGIDSSHYLFANNIVKNKVVRSHSICVESWIKKDLYISNELTEFKINSIYVKPISRNSQIDSILYLDASLKCKLVNYFYPNDTISLDVESFRSMVDVKASYEY